MKSARRVPRVVGTDEATDPPSDSSTSTIQPVTFVKRPNSKPKKPSNLRTSITAADDNDDEIEASVLAVKRPPSTLKRHAIPPRPSTRESSTELPIHTPNPADRPAYDAATLAELKSSTPSRYSPAPAKSDLTPPANASTAFDITSKFGDSALTLSHDPLAADPNGSHVPSEAEIREKKDRRRRLAAEERAGVSSRNEAGADFISLDDTGNRADFDAPSDFDAHHNDRSQTNNLIIPADDLDLRSKYGETRLVREDEDIAEGFDDFVEDAGRVTLKGKAAREQERERKKEMERQIRAAQRIDGYGALSESGSEDDVDGDGERKGGDEGDKEEAARNAAYEAAQTRAGTYGLNTTGSRAVKERDKEEKQRKRLELPRTKPLPELKSVVARFGELVKGKEAEVAEKRKRLERVKREQVEIAREEERVKALLKEAGERFEKLRTEVGGEPAVGDAVKERAMETFRDVKGDAQPEVIPVDDSSEDEDARPGFGGLGSLSGRSTGMSMSGMARPPQDEDDDDYY